MSALWLAATEFSGLATFAVLFGVVVAFLAFGGKP